MYLAMTSEAVLNDPANDEDPDLLLRKPCPGRRAAHPGGSTAGQPAATAPSTRRATRKGCAPCMRNGRKRHERIAKIEVSVVPTEGGTLIEDEDSPSTYWRAIRNDTREAIIVTADDVAWVLANPVLAMSGSRGYGRMWIIRNIEGVGLDMRVEVDVKPVMLLDVDGVINAITKKPATFAWPRASWRTGKAV